MGKVTLEDLEKAYHWLMQASGLEETACMKVANWIGTEMGNRHIAMMARSVSRETMLRFG